jgi:predicted DCC family thiol-disulfide oxidoreductase YuxK
MKLVGGLFTRRGFEWVPLQTPGLAGRLQIPEAALGEEMKLQLADGRVIGGIDTWGHLLRSIGWLWPLGFALSLPGIHFVSQICYRFIARNRYCLGGKCFVRTNQRRRTIPFLDLP